MERVNKLPEGTFEEGLIFMKIRQMQQKNEEDHQNKMDEIKNESITIFKIGILLIVILNIVGILCLYSIH